MAPRRGTQRVGQQTPPVQPPDVDPGSNLVIERTNSDLAVPAGVYITF